MLRTTNADLSSMGSFSGARVLSGMTGLEVNQRQECNDRSLRRESMRDSMALFRNGCSAINSFSFREVRLESSTELGTSSSSKEVQGLCYGRHNDDRGRIRRIRSIKVTDGTRGVVGKWKETRTTPDKEEEGRLMLERVKHSITMQYFFLSLLYSFIPSSII